LNGTELFLDYQGLWCKISYIYSRHRLDLRHIPIFLHIKLKIWYTRGHHVIVYR